MSDLCKDRPPRAYRGVIWRDEHGSLSLTSVPFVLLQLSILLVFTTHVSWTGVALCAGLYAVRMFAITGFFHRYFSHRTFRMGRVMQAAAAILGSTAVQKGVIWWAVHHRNHHQYSDTAADSHNSHEGFWHSHILWFLYRESEEVSYDSAGDLTRYPELVWIDRHWMWFPGALALGLYALGGYHWLVWGFFVSTVLVQNGTYCINSLMHYWGRRYFATGDESRNHWLLALITLGEGWHNNHHRYQASARNGFYWWEYDPTYYGLRLLAALGLVHDLKPVPAKILAEGRVNRRLRREARRIGCAYRPIPVLHSEVPVLSDPAGARARLLQLELESLRALVGERVRLAQAEMQRLQEQVGAYGRRLQLELHDVGSNMRLEVERLQQQVNERGRQICADVGAAQEQIVERAHCLAAELHELRSLVAARGRSVRVDVHALGEQLATTGRELRAELQEVGEQLALGMRALRAEIERLDGRLPTTA